MRKLRTWTNWGNWAMRTMSMKPIRSTTLYTLPNRQVPRSSSRLNHQYNWNHSLKTIKHKLTSPAARIKKELPFHWPLHCIITLFVGVGVGMGRSKINSYTYYSKMKACRTKSTEFIPTLTTFTRIAERVWDKGCKEDACNCRRWLFGIPK